ncbi:MAG: anti-FecI sigma factor, FecR [Verrucomicrobia bacterium]|nr:anti-FecI sigma factor, FecR [Verrucomicrobiota bacterium]
MSRSAAINEEIEDQAARWVARRDAGLTAAQKREFERWHAEPAHAAAFAEHATLFGALAEPRRQGAAEDFKRELARLSKRRTRRRIGQGSAAAFLVIAGFFAWSSSRTLTPPELSRAVVVAPMKQTLPDGSVIEAPAEARFAFDYTEKSRRVHLFKGQALFTVAKNKERPFIVDAGGVEFRAVGTAFSVQLGSAQAALLVTEGRVAVDQPGTIAAKPLQESSPLATVHTIAFVGAGEEMRVDLMPSAPVAPVLPIASAQMTEQLAWRNPQVEFSGAPLSEVVTLVNRYSDEKFVLADPALAAVALSGRFRADDPTAIAEALQTAFGIDVRREGKTLYLSRQAKR